MEAESDLVWLECWVECLNVSFSLVYKLSSPLITWKDGCPYHPAGSTHGLHPTVVSMLLYHLTLILCCARKRIVSLYSICVYTHTHTDTHTFLFQPLCHRQED